MTAQNEVEIRFTASTGEVVANIEDVREALAGLTQPVAGVTGALGGLRTAFSTALQPTTLTEASKAFDSLNTKAAQTALQLREMASSMRLADLAYATTKQHLAAELKLHEITYEQETAALLAALDQRRAKEEQALDGELALYARGSVQYEKVLDQRAQKEARYFAERQRIVDQAALHEAQQWKAVADQIASAFNSNLQKLLAGTETWSQAMKKISASLILKLIEDQVKLTLEWLANQARILVGHIAAETGMTTATAAGAALRAAAQTAGGQTSILETLANALKAIFASAGQTAAAVSASVAPTTGPAAPAIGAAAGAAVVAEATGLADSAHAIGDWVVPSTGLGFLHKNEMVVPERGGFAEGFRRAMGGARTAPTGGDTHVHIAALDSRSISRFFNDNAHHMVRALQRGLKNGAHLPLRTSTR